MQAVIKVYLKGSTTFEYVIEAKSKLALNAKAREHAGKIMAEGFRHCDNDGAFEWFGPHWIDKVKVVGGVTTNYPSRPSGT